MLLTHDTKLDGVIVCEEEWGILSQLTLVDPGGAMVNYE